MHLLRLSDRERGAPSTALTQFSPQLPYAIPEFQRGLCPGGNLDSLP